MRTTKKSKCNGDCCTNSANAKEELEEPVQPSDRPQSSYLTYINKIYKCDCQRKKTECSDECGCTVETCNNRHMSEKQAMILGSDVIEKVSWGMDICTQVNFLTICPRNLTYKEQSEFVEKKIIYAI